VVVKPRDRNADRGNQEKKASSWSGTQKLVSRMVKRCDQNGKGTATVGNLFDSSPNKWIRNSSRGRNLNFQKPGLPQGLEGA